MFKSRQYIYSKKENRSLIRLTADNLLADMFELIGIYKTYIKEKNGNLIDIDDFIAYYDGKKIDTNYGKRHFRNIGEKIIKNSLLKDKTINIPRRAFRRIASTKERYRVKTHIKSDEIYKFTLSYIFKNEDCKILKSVFVKKFILNSNYNKFIEYIPNHILKFQYDSLCDYYEDSNDTILKIIESWDSLEIGEMIIRSIQGEQECISENTLINQNQNIVYYDDMEIAGFKLNDLNDEK